MALFVAAANGRLLPTKTARSEAELESAQEGKRVFVSIVPRQPVPILNAARSYVGSLSEAFLVVWQHYSGDERQACICARVLGFHLLAERTNGEIMKDWITPDRQNPEVVLLHPVVIDAIASVPLTADGAFSESSFVEEIVRVARLRDGAEEQ